jgi:hypothetical protein
VTKRPILFSGPMVLALLAGTKTMTRRVDLKWAPSLEGFTDDYIRDPGNACACPHGEVGDSLWVRERIVRITKLGELSCYAADGAITKADAWPWERDSLPSIHCPRGLSRINLAVTSVRIERLQEITGEDAAAEGISVPRCGCERCGQTSEMCPATASDHIDAFRDLWESLNGKRAGCTWSDNPWVWVLGFTTEVHS